MSTASELPKTPTAKDITLRISTCQLPQKAKTTLQSTSIM